MLGFLLARAGVDVVVLEKHADFLRDFRGDTIHPSTLEVMGELGLLDEFLKLPHQKAPTISAFFGGREYAFADFTHLPTRCKFIALMPQWDFLNFLAEQGKALSDVPPAHAGRGGRPDRGGRPRRRRARRDAGRGARECAPTSPSDATAATRPCARAPGSRPRISARRWTCCGSGCRNKPSDHGETMGRFDAGRIVVLIDRGDYWQCAFLISKGAIEETKRAGLPAFRRERRAG